MTISALGDSAVVVTLGERVDAGMARRVRAVVAELEHHRPPGVDDVVGAFASVAVFYDRTRSADFETLRAALEKAVASADESAVNVASREVEIPVCYGGEFGPDLDAVATHAGLSAAEVIARHSGGDYLVHAIGFAPGFPYLGGLAPALATPRRATPRPQVAAGSVAIGGTQTGIYPLASPGGWNLIGRTPLALFDAGRAEPALLRAGDRVKFRAMDRAAYDARAAVEPPMRPATRRHQNGTTEAAIDVLRAGMLTTVQDLGRPGHRAQGVPLGGAADPMALRVANLLVGNVETATELEFTLVGPELRFRADTIVALGGGDFGLPRWQPLRMRAGDTLKFGAARHGCRGYLAVAGGIDVQPVLGSGSTYLRARLGGLEGRSLQDGDVLPRHPVAREFRGHWHIDERILPDYSHSPTVRVVAGMHAPQFRPDWPATAFTVTPRSDRMGMRLAGEPLRREQELDLVSSPVAPGTIQVPPDGQPIVLLADAQTIGGYPQLAHVIAVDLPLVAQLRPGDTVRFERVTLDEAHALLLARERALGMLREGVAQKLA